MGYLPIFVDVSGHHCVVIGGGEIAERKTRSLIGAGAAVTVVSPSLTPGLAGLADRGTIRYHARRYRAGDLAGAFLVYEATGEIETGRAAAAEAQAGAMLINVADVPDLCSFIAPAVIKRGDLQIAVSTGGASPAFARRIREDLEDRFGPEYEVMVEVLAAARKWLKTRVNDAGTRARQLVALAGSDLRECLGRGDLGAAEAVVRRVIGASLLELGLDPAACATALAGGAAPANGRASAAR